MKIRHSLSRIEEMEDYLTELAGRNEEYISFQKEAAQVNEIWKSVYEKYGRKLERIRGQWQQPVSAEEVERLKREVFDESISTRLKRFFGLKGKQLDEYNQLMDRLDFLRAYTGGQVEQTGQRIEEAKKALEKCLDEYEAAYEKVFREYSGSSKSGWDDYVFPEKPEHLIYIGDMTMEITDREEDEAFLRSALDMTMDETRILAPCILDLDEPIKLGIVYSNDQEKQKASGLVRSVIFQAIRHLPLYQYQFTCLDYKNSGSYLGELRGLERFVDPYADGIHTELFEEYYRMLTMASTEGSIAETMNALENYIDNVSRILGGMECAGDYNRVSEKKIPHLFFIMDAYPEGFHDSSRKKFEKIISNGARCGISVIVTMDKGAVEGFVASMRNLGLKGNEYGLIFCGKNEEELVFDTIRGPFLINDMYERRQPYVESVLRILEASRNVDNRFESVFDLSVPFGQMDSTKWVTVPFTINARGKVGSLCLGSHTYYANALLSGSAGSGKSTLLHMLINSIIMNYTPEDVQLWLVDYKLVEFFCYTQGTPPHIKFIGLDRSSEFTYSFIDHIKTEMDRRLKLFTESGVANIVDYKKKYGKDSLARIIIIIDEFHVMTNQIQGTEYAVKLEEFLKEARAAGMTCVFSDQVVSTGLRGLTEAGRMQIRTRLAMSNDDPQEIKETLALSGGEWNIRPMGQGEVTIKRYVDGINAEGNKVTQVSLDCEKVIYISGEMREIVCARAAEAFPKGEEPLIVNGKARAAADWKMIEAYDEENERDGRSWLHLGKPSNLEKCFCIRLLRNFGQNVMSIGADADLQASLLFHAIASFRHQPDRKIYILADESDDIYVKYESRIRKLGREPDVELVNDYEGICRTVCELQQEMYSRRKRQKPENIMVFWLGLDNMALEFSYYPPNKPASLAQIGGTASRKKRTATSIEDSLSEFDKSFAAMFGETMDSAENELQPEDETEEEETLYNASEDIGELTGEGPKRGIHHFVLLPSVLPLKKARFIRLENFVCKIGFQMDDDSSLDYFGKSRLTKELSPEQAVYYDGGKIVRNFLPYMLTEGTFKK